jgi:hypothetical protein
VVVRGNRFEMLVKSVVVESIWVYEGGSNGKLEDVV